jgi:hypothetical protein
MPCFGGRLSALNLFVPIGRWKLAYFLFLFCKGGRCSFEEVQLTHPLLNLDWMDS